MLGPKSGALGATFSIVRFMQIASLIAIIGMTANFIAQIVEADSDPNSLFIGILIVTCIAVLYCVITYVLYLDALLPFLITAIMDTFLLVAVIIVACLVGKPISTLDCPSYRNDAGSVTAFIDSVGSNIASWSVYAWSGTSRSTCLEMKSIWGLSMALSILFAVSSIANLCMWKARKAILEPAKSVV